MDEIDELAHSPELDDHVLLLELGLEDLPHVRCSQEAAARLRNGNAAPVVAQDIAFGAECWASCDGQPVAIGQFRAGSMDPTRVFNLDNAL